MCHEFDTAQSAATRIFFGRTDPAHRLPLSGKIAIKAPCTVDQLHALPQESADADGVQARRRNSAARARLSLQAAHPDQARLQNPKFVTTLYVTDKMPRGYWSDRGYNWFSGS
jgi:DMSO/TMAO reductase YedYZ molybdopterin-dependent catalytic subunit